MWERALSSRLKPKTSPSTPCTGNGTKCLKATQQAIAACQARGGKVVAVGTTTVRTLESWARSGQASGDTQIFITPGFEFRVVDRLITNFHLPKSTLMMLVSAFAGYEHIMGLYRHAIAQHAYRFFSYGDAMLLTRSPPP